MKYILLIILSLSFMACSVKREIILPDQTIYTVKAQKDDMITFKLSKDGDLEFICDGRGKAGMIEQALGIMFMNLPDVEIGTGD